MAVVDTITGPWNAASLILISPVAYDRMTLLAELES